MKTEKEKAMLRRQTREPETKDPNNARGSEREREILRVMNKRWKTQERKAPAPH
jgi:hypothetical protein